MSCVDPGGSAAGRVSLEAAGPEDLDVLLDLDRRCYSHPWTREHFRAAMGDAGRGRLIVLRAAHARGEPGRGLLAYCAFEVVADEAQIHTVAVHPQRRRQGLGRLIVRLALGLMARRGARSVWLEVRAGNQEARALYAALEFRALSVRRDYYRQPVEDALVMVREGLRPQP